LVFAATVLYYSRIYYTSTNVLSSNKRTLWYQQNHGMVRLTIMVLTTLAVADILFIIVSFSAGFRGLHKMQWLLMIIFPTIAFLYTYKAFRLKNMQQLRAIGWLKPFFIGFTWSGLVTVYPVVFKQMQHSAGYDQVILPSPLFWLQNFLFISALAVLFDIKDLKDDLRQQLKTYPALLGKGKAIRWVVLPAALLSFIFLWMFLYQQQAGPAAVAIQTIPYLLLLLITATINNQGILFYLLAIDGLMFLKGVCGIVSILFF